MNAWAPTDADNIRILRAASTQCDLDAWERSLDAITDDRLRGTVRASVLAFVTAVKDAAYAVGRRQGGAR